MARVKKRTVSGAATSKRESCACSPDTKASNCDWSGKVSETQLLLTEAETGLAVTEPGRTATPLKLGETEGVAIAAEAMESSFIFGRNAGRYLYYKEKYCHQTGKPSDGKTSMANPIL